VAVYLRGRGGCPSADSDASVIGFYPLQGRGRDQKALRDVGLDFMAPTVSVDEIYPTPIRVSHTTLTQRERQEKQDSIGGVQMATPRGATLRRGGSSASCMAPANRSIWWSGE